MSDELARELASRSDEGAGRAVGASRRARVPARRPADPGRRGRADGAGAGGRATSSRTWSGRACRSARRRSTPSPACWPRTAARSTSSHDVVWRHRGKKIAPKTVNQKRYVDAIRRSTITFGIGPAGTGKTYLAIALAVAALVDREVSRIILTRPAVEAGERLGLPARRHRGEGRPVPAAAVRRAQRHARRRARAAVPREGHRRGRAAGVHARAHAERLASSSSTRRRTPRPSR